jgi:N-acetylglutamate synthase-like GNAT family acetyltransferase
MLTIREAREEDRPRVTAFYSLAGYSPPLESSDRILIAETDDRIVGALRLCNEEGVVLLRGMRVLESMRRQHVGGSLLAAFDEILADGTCYCIPHEYLEAFYGKIGFRSVSLPDAPRILQERWQEYRRRGLNVIIMKREARSA